MLDEKIFRELFDSHAAVMFVIDPAGEVIMWGNRAAIDFYGYAREQLEGMPIYGLNVMFPKGIRKNIRRSQEGKQNLFVFQHRLANGDIRAEVVLDGEPPDTLDAIFMRADQALYFAKEAGRDRTAVLRAVCPNLA